MKTTKVIGLWLDRTSDPTNPQWIVSRDTMNENGEAETTSTLYIMANYDRAEAAAIELARKESIPVVLTRDDNTQECVYSGKVITIQDGIGHLRETVRLSGGLHGTDWVVILLNSADIDEEMDDADIEEEVYRVFCEGYEGDPQANGLTVTCEDDAPAFCR